MSEPKPNVIRETDAEAVNLAKLLVRTARFGALAVLDKMSGAPLASRVAVATDHDGSPLILVSSLSAHTGAMLADPRCSLLLGEPGKGDPLAHPRITLSCRAEKLDRQSSAGIRARRRYLARQPKAALYADFGDFSFFRLEIQKASLNGGFGKAYNLTRADIVIESPALEALAEAEQGAVEHMNADHADAVAIYASVFARPAGSGAGGGWIMTGVDVEGFDIASGDEIRRVFFPRPLADAAELRPVLVKLARDGRALGK